MPISPSVTTTLLTKELASQGCPWLKTNATSITTAEAASSLCPSEQLVSGRPYGPKSAATLPGSDNPGVRWTDPLRDGVYQISEILSPVGWPQVLFISTEDYPQAFAEIEMELLMFQQTRTV